MGEPKALLPFRGRTFVEHSAQLFGRLGEVVVMTSGNLDAVVAKLLPNVIIGRNPKPEDGLFSSVRLGVDLLPPAVRRLFVLPVDCVLPDATVPRMMMEAAAGADGGVVVPVFRGTRGHPVLLEEEAFRATPEYPPTEIFSDFLAHFRVAKIPVDEEWILLNINEPGDYNDFLASEEKRGDR